MVATGGLGNMGMTQGRAQMGRDREAEGARRGHLGSEPGGIRCDSAARGRHVGVLLPVVGLFDGLNRQVQLPCLLFRSRGMRDTGEFEESD